jgi:hypothetical protein
MAESLFRGVLSFYFLLSAFTLLIRSSSLSSITQGLVNFSNDIEHFIDFPVLPGMCLKTLVPGGTFHFGESDLCETARHDFRGAVVLRYKNSTAVYDKIEHLKQYIAFRYTVSQYI